MEIQKRPLILIAEDDDGNYLIEKYELRNNFELVRAVDGLDVIEKCEQVNPDLIVMDIRMPNLNGIEAMRRIKQKHPDLPIAALTAFAYNGEEQLYIEYGFDAFFIKPIKREILVKGLKDLLNR